ncbi:MAG: carbohydate-binding domain-containing protein, partial [Cyclobacteriaceae bacterium]|nr:carbohydate-binding domain-containing protein [Cyclobacteriaceae bacterium]
MKNVASFIIFLSFTLSITNCTQSTMDYSSAEKIEIKWELITNFTDVDGAFEAKFILDNKSEIELTNNWSLFFNINARPIIEPPSPQPGVVKHINGDWFQLVPNSDFSLKPNESTEILYRGMEGVIKEADGPLGTYFVFYNKDGAEKQIVEVACEVLPFTKPDQINRNKEDQEPIPTAEYRYHNNQGMSVLPEDQLLKIIPSPVQIKNLGGSTQIDENWIISHEIGLQNEAGYLAEKLGAITGSTFKTSDNSSAKNQIAIKTSNITVNNISKEAYHLTINEDGIQIIGSDAAGVFYGVQSLLSLVPLKAYQNQLKSIEFELMSIKDAPRFGFRGLHADVCRNFQNKETIFR